MTKEELREKRNLAIENLNYAIAILGSDELYIDELEKEIAELKEQNTNLQEMLKTERSVTCKEEYLKKVTELEQENAELREKYVKECEDVAFVVTNYSKQLTKAKELIRTLLLIADNKISQMEFQLCVADAKQFLNSEVDKC